MLTGGCGGGVYSAGYPPQGYPFTAAGIACVCGVPPLHCAGRSADCSRTGTALLPSLSGRGILAPLPLPFPLGAVQVPPFPGGRQGAQAGAVPQPPWASSGASTSGQPLGSRAPPPSPRPSLRGDQRSTARPSCLAPGPLHPLPRCLQGAHDSSTFFNNLLETTINEKKKKKNKPRKQKTHPPLPKK